MQLVATSPSERGELPRLRSSSKLLDRSLSIDNSRNSLKHTANYIHVLDIPHDTHRAILSLRSIEQTHTASPPSDHHDFSFRNEPLGPRERSTPLPVHLAHSRLLAHHHGDFENGDDTQSKQDSLPSDRHSDRRESEETVAAKSRAEETSRTCEGRLRHWSMCVCFLRFEEETLLRKHV